MASDAYKDQKPWRIIDGALRKAVTDRGVQVKFLVNDHASRVELMKEQLLSLQLELFPNFEVRLFDVRDDVI